MANKLIPEEIKKALKRHSMNLCSECKVQRTTLCNDCISEIQRNALDLINRQQAEIEKIQKNVLKYEDIFIGQQAEIEQRKEEANRYQTKLKLTIKTEYTPFNLKQAITIISKQLKRLVKKQSIKKIKQYLKNGVLKQEQQDIYKRGEDK